MRPHPSPRSPLAQGFQPSVPLLPVVEMSPAHSLASYHPPRTVGAQPLRRMTHLVCPRGGGVQLPVARLPLDRDRPQTVAVVAPSWPAFGLGQRLPTSSAKDSPTQTTLPLPVLLPVPIAVRRGSFGQRPRAQAAQTHGFVSGLISLPRVNKLTPCVMSNRLLPHFPLQPPRGPRRAGLKVQAATLTPEGLVARLRLIHQAKREFQAGLDF